jgi:hypothetical protein
VESTTEGESQVLLELKVKALRLGQIVEFILSFWVLFFEPLGGIRSGARSRRHRAGR